MIVLYAVSRMVGAGISDEKWLNSHKISDLVTLKALPSGIKLFSRVRAYVAWWKVMLIYGCNVSVLTVCR